MKKYLEVIQEENSDCGICCLSSIIKYYKGYIPLEILRLNTNTNNDGTNAYELINYAKRIGFNSYGEKVNNLEKLKLPLIAHLKLNNNIFHFVVIYEINNKFLLIMDPSIGFKKYNVNDFNKLFTGVIINFIPNSIIPMYKENKFLKNKLISYVRDNKLKISGLIIINLIILIFSLIINLEIKILEKNINYVYGLAVIILITQILNYIKNIIIMNTSIDFNNKLIKYFVSHIFKLPLKYLKLKQKGEITTRFRELNDLSNNILNIFVEISFNFLIIIILLIIIKKLFITLSIIITIFTIIYVFINIKVFNKLFNIIKFSINMEENYNSCIIDYITKFITIKHLYNYNFFTNNIEKNIKLKNNVVKSINRKIFKIDLINNIIFSSLILYLLYILLKNNYNTSNSIVLIFIINYYISVIKKIIDIYPNYILIKNIIFKNNEFLSIEYDIKKDININNFKSIKINNIYYSFYNNVVLNNFNYIINNNDKIFINGPSGVGKSTFLKILTNELDDYKGNILLNDKNIKNYNINNIISYTSQDEDLFNDTIYNNLTVGLNINETLVNDVINICRLKEIKNIDLNNIIINSNSFSGGEKNRIILARSLLKSKKIIILDEVLKEVDYEMELIIIKDILNYFKDRVIIYVSHKDVSFLFNKVLTFRKE